MKTINSQKQINVIIADDHSPFRKGLKQIISELPIVRNVHEAANGREVLQLLGKGRYKLVLLDIAMPGMDGLEAALKIHEQYPHVLILVISVSDDTYTIKQMYRAGCHGYLVKNACDKEIQQAVILVLSGQKYFEPHIMEKLVTEPENKIPVLDPFYHRMIKLICDEKTNQQIADELNMNKKQIDNYRAALYGKIGANNTAGVVRYAIHNKIIAG